MGLRRVLTFVRPGGAALIVSAPLLSDRTSAQVLSGVDRGDSAEPVLDGCRSIEAHVLAVPRADYLHREEDRPGRRLGAPLPVARVC